MSPRMGAKGIGALAREPLVHFTLVGVLLFALDAALGGEGDEEVDQGAASSASGASEIVIDEGVRRELRDAFEHRHDRAPTEEELEGLVLRWTEREILYREGIERGLDRDDPRVRATVADAMRFVLEAQLTLEEPDDAALRGYFEANASRFSSDATYDFTQVFVGNEEGVAQSARDDRAAAFLEDLRAGASPAGLGDTFSGGRRYRARRLEDLAQIFGEALSQGLSEQRPGTWARYESRYGVHLVRLDEVHAASGAALESVRADVHRAWVEEQRAALLEARIAELRARWSVVER